nr:beta-alanine transporter-like [Cherax quadricarinatus]
MTTTNFDDILNKLEIGPWNLMIFLLCSLWGVFAAMQAVGTAFLSPATDHWCRLPELNHWTNAQVWSYALPRTTVGGLPQHSQCEMYTRNYSLLVGVPWEERLQHLPEGDVEEESLPTQPCEAWQYDTSTFSSTLISEWNLVCGRETLRSLIQSVYMMGYAVGSPLGGFFSDRFGRKRVMSIALWVFILVSITGSFSPYYELFLLCRFLIAFSSTIVYQASYILAVESCTRRQRGVVGILFSVPSALGFMLLPCIAYYVREWRALHLAVSVPVIVLIANTILLPESPRWLLHSGKWRQAEIELLKAARWNRGKSFDTSWLRSTLTQLKAESEVTPSNQVSVTPSNQKSVKRPPVRSLCNALQSEVCVTPSSQKCL